MSTIEQAYAQIPAPAELHELCITLAALDALTATRFPKFKMGVNANENSRWFLCDDGAGNTMSVLFSDAGVFIKGFDHESCMSPHAKGREYKNFPGLFTGFPPALRKYLENPALIGDDEPECFPATFDDGTTLKVPATTFCTWWDAGSKRWLHGKIAFPKFEAHDSDGASFLIESLNTDRFCEEYDWSETLVPAIEQRKPITEAMLAGNKRKPDPARLAAYLSEIGYGVRCPLDL